MLSGMLAAETIFEAMVSGDYSRAQLGKYETRVMESYIGKDL